MNPLLTEIMYLKGVGPKRAALYNKLGIKNVWDLLRHYPRKYIDYTDFKPISETEIGETCTICAVVTRRLPPQRIRDGMIIYKAVLTDGESDIIAVFFNSEYMFDKLRQDETYYLHGKIAGNEFRMELNTPEFISVNSEVKIQPKYNLTNGLTHNVVAKNVETALALAGSGIEECYNCEILERYELLPIKKALKNIHFPSGKQQYEAAKKRLAFDELLLLQLGLLLLKHRNKKQTGAVLPDKPIDEFFKALPFELTNAQKKAIGECISDMQNQKPMSRLLQGDVGSGKTAVAAATCYYAHICGVQAVMMAPTEILAVQHYNTLNTFLNPLGVNVRLLTGSIGTKAKREIKSELESGECTVIAGTHALLQDNTVFSRLGLVITDEQHRFGVSQRAKLLGKGNNPHMLVMSATPIPRTLALTIYGDLDISVLNEMPKGRIPIETYCVDDSYRQRLYNFIKKHVKMGRQAYIVCPSIDENGETTSVKEYYDKVCGSELSDIPVGLLHGKMKAAEKERVMKEFLNNNISVLIATTVIEVGVDVPNAVIIIIENSERFGLSQLHQLRGRVGRGAHQSFCILISNSENEYSKSRLEVMKQSADGFEIANKDLELRGPGDFFGQKQHGLPRLRIADLSQDLDILQKTKSLALEIIENDFELKEHVKLKAMVDELFAECERIGEY